MNREQIWREFDTLPPQAQQQVADFIAFLHSRTSQATPATPSASSDFANEPFVGMWQDREDMSDSNIWVRQVRTREWTQGDD
ncbi:MAG TPA: DUF2281 domain-containing protein [Herpetosiphonaceae bacterium]